MTRFEEIIDQLADELMEWEKWMAALTPEDREAELAAIEWRMTQPEQRGPCAERPPNRKEQRMPDEKYPPVNPEEDYPPVVPYKIIVEYEVLAGSEEEAIDQFDDWLNFDEIKAIPLDEAEAPSDDTWAIDELVNFVRTPDWSSSMLEDIAEIVMKVRPEIGELGDFIHGDEREWRKH